MAAQSRPGPLPPVLLTRPAGQGARFADLLRARLGPSVRVVSSPVLAPMLLSPDLPPGPFEAIVFTSETAVAAFHRLNPDGLGQAWCVGRATAAAAQAAGYAARSADGDAGALAQAIRAAGLRGPVLHPQGRETAFDMAGALASAGIETIDLIVYAQEPQPLTPEAAALLLGKGPVIVPLFSPRSATLLAGDPAVSGRHAPLWIAAMSPAVAVASKALRPARTATARHPDADAMLTAIEDLVWPTAEP